MSADNTCFPTPPPCLRVAYSPSPGYRRPHLILYTALWSGSLITGAVIAGSMQIFGSWRQLELMLPDALSSTLWEGLIQARRRCELKLFRGGYLCHLPASRGLATAVQLHGQSGLHNRPRILLSELKALYRSWWNSVACMYTCLSLQGWYVGHAASGTGSHIYILTSTHTYIYFFFGTNHRNWKINNLYLDNIHKRRQQSILE